MDVYSIDKGTDPVHCGRGTSTALVLSYEQMVSKARQLKALQFYVVIFDESHMLKDQKAKRTKVAMELARQATRRILLSGTPALSRPAELYSQAKLVDPGLFPSFMEFAQRYCEGKQGRFGYEAKGATNLEELGAVLQKALMLRWALFEFVFCWLRARGS